MKVALNDLFARGEGQAMYLLPMTLTGIIGALIIGFIVGAIAKLLVPGPEPGGCLVTVAIGIVGSILASWIGRNFFHLVIEERNPLRPVGFLPSLIGAVLVLLIYHAVRGTRRPRL